MSEVVKSTLTIPTFDGVGCRARVTDQVVVEVEVPGGRQTVNFPVTALPAVEALLSTVVSDDDVQVLIVQHTPDPEPEEPGGEGEPTP